MANPTPFAELNTVLCELVTSVQAILADNFVAAYLQGSFAVGHFDTDSDVDFLIVTENEIADETLADLQEMHGELYEMEERWARHLEGSYITREALRRYEAGAEPLLYLDNGSRELIRSHHDNTLVVRWILREHGITLAGPEPESLIEPVAAETLRQEVLTVMHDWAKQLRAEPEQMNNGWYQPFVVISYCRMLQTLRTEKVLSKRAGTEWAETALESRWTRLIQRAVAARQCQYARVHLKADSIDFVSTFDFIEYALQESTR